MRARGGASAIVLAGGRSGRFGSQKLALIVDGEPLLHRAIRAAARTCDELIVVGPAGGLPVELPTDLRIEPVVVEDEEAFPGPLVALTRGTHLAARDRLLLIAGDMPDLQSAVLRRVLAWRPGHDGASLVFQGIDQPFPMGLDRAAVSRHAPRLVGRGERSLRALTSTLHLERVPETEWVALDPAGRSLRDIDRPTDVA